MPIGTDATDTTRGASTAGSAEARGVAAQGPGRSVLALLIVAIIVTTLGVVVIASLALTVHPHGSGSPRLWTSVAVLPIAGIDERRHSPPRTLSLPD